MVSEIALNQSTAQFDIEFDIRKAHFTIAILRFGLEKLFPLGVNGLSPQKNIAIRSCDCTIFNGN